MLGNALDLFIVIVGFGLIVFVHELGHFLAARWAGVRVLAFALGFGPALVSYRKGLGFRRGSTEGEYQRAFTEEPEHALAMSPTEYRFNAVPFGGYVRMLGQDDLDPSAVSAAKDSYQNCSVPKRMVIISAGVIVNLISAGLLFIAVFGMGLKVEPPLIGGTQAGSPAATAVATNAEAFGITEPGLQPGDRVTLLNGKPPERFDHLIVAAAMTGPGETLTLEVDRPGINGPLRFEIEPKRGEITRLLELGALPMISNRVEPETPSGTIALEGVLAALGLEEVPIGSTLVRVDDIDVTDGQQAADALDASANGNADLTFRTPDNTEINVRVPTSPELTIDRVPGDENVVRPYAHLLGLTPVMRVSPIIVRDGPAQGLEPGDIFARVGSVEYPTIARGRAEIQSRLGRPIDLVVLRENELGDLDRIALTANVGRDGTVGFLPDDTAAVDTLSAIPPARLTMPGSTDPFEPAAASIITKPGTRIVAIDRVPVETFSDIRRVLGAVAEAAAATDRSLNVTLELPRTAAQTEAGEPAMRVERSWLIPGDQLARVLDLGYTADALGVLALETKIQRAEGPIEAIGMGIEETKVVMLTTYLTIARLFQGTVRVEHLKGPVGIAHIGTRLADKGWAWLLFYMALLSVNLAVINFLPLPIVDGGQFVFLLWEGIRGKPVPVPVQNVATLAGLVLIGSAFLVVTFNDIMGIFGG